MAHKQATQDEVILALRETGGIISDAAKKLGLASVNGLRKRIKNSTTLSEAIEEIREETKDIAEGNIISALKAGDKDISKWYLASLGRDRGFGTKSEVEVKGNLSVNKEVDLSGLSIEELKQLEEIAKKVTGNSETD